MLMRTPLQAERVTFIESNARQVLTISGDCDPGATLWNILLESEAEGRFSLDIQRDMPQGRTIGEAPIVRILPHPEASDEAVDAMVRAWVAINGHVRLLPRANPSLVVNTHPAPLASRQMPIREVLAAALDGEVNSQDKVALTELVQATMDEQSV